MKNLTNKQNTWKLTAVLFQYQTSIHIPRSQKQPSKKLGKILDLEYFCVHSILFGMFIGRKLESVYKVRSNIECGSVRLKHIRDYTQNLWSRERWICRVRLSRVYSTGNIMRTAQSNWHSDRIAVVVREVPYPMHRLNYWPTIPNIVVRATRCRSRWGSTTTPSQTPSSLRSMDCNVVYAVYTSMPTQIVPIIYYTLHSRSSSSSSSSSGSCCCYIVVDPRCPAYSAERSRAVVTPRTGYERLTRSRPLIEPFIAALAPSYYTYISCLHHPA